MLFEGGCELPRQETSAHMIARPLADGAPSEPGSVRSHDREGVVFSKYETIFVRRGAKAGDHFPAVIAFKKR